MPGLGLEQKSSCNVGRLPSFGYAGCPKLVVDLETIHVLEFISQMNPRLEYQGNKGSMGWNISLIVNFYIMPLGTEPE
ncbi:methylenetetrahydrofolate reductase [Carboxydothermus pertinax]|uniref:Methylenetetrahydrofolate reductase n=1 Tax=Carboxydothermus pertinax TaxID=870242 RepID=A0A1L8CWK0_9THEO|nr:methylenetetrahydrofolate reductase [Carboxydothermus pertinax]